MAGKNIGLDLSIIGPRVAAVGARHEPRMASPGSGPSGRRLRTAVGLAVTAALLFAVPVQVLAQAATVSITPATATVAEGAAQVITVTLSAMRNSDTIIPP